MADLYAGGNPAVFAVQLGLVIGFLRIFLVLAQR